MYYICLHNAHICIYCADFCWSFFNALAILGLLGTVYLSWGRTGNVLPTPAPFPSALQWYFINHSPSIASSTCPHPIGPICTSQASFNDALVALCNGFNKLAFVFFQQDGKLIRKNNFCFIKFHQTLHLWRCFPAWTGVGVGQCAIRHWYQHHRMQTHPSAMDLQTCRNGTQLFGTVKSAMVVPLVFSWHVPSELLRRGKEQYLPSCMQHVMYIASSTTLTKGFFPSMLFLPSTAPSDHGAVVYRATPKRITRERGRIRSRERWPPAMLCKLNPREQQHVCTNFVQSMQTKLP